MKFKLPPPWVIGVAYVLAFAALGAGYATDVEPCWIWGWC